MTRFPKTFSAIAAGLLLGSAGASAADVELHGYFRSGAGSNSEGGNIVCYRLPQSAVWFRLGNECDTYVALTFASNLGKTDGTTFRAQFTTAQGTQGVANWEQSTPALREAFVEAQDLGAGMKMDWLKGSSLWIGKRYYKNPDIHMLDYTYWEPAQGPGWGLDNVNAGIGKFSYAMIRIGDFSGYGAESNLGGYNPGLIGGGTRSATVHDFRLQDMAVLGGKLTAGVDLVFANNRDNTSTSTSGTTTVDNTAGDNGTAVTVTHAMDDLFGLGGGNTIGLQYANKAATLKGFGWGGNTTGGSEWLLFDSWYIAPKGSAFQATATAGYRKSDRTGGEGNEWWVGARPVYNLNNIWSLFSEVGLQSVTPKGADSQKLAKVTLGTAFSMGPGVWSRPSLRFFGTYAKWNDAAAAASGGVARSGRDFNSIADGFADKRSAFSYGVQVEAWF